MARAGGWVQVQAALPNALLWDSMVVSDAYDGEGRGEGWSRGEGGSSITYVQYE